ncbi:hypothetical protein [Chloroflexus sp.]|nr:hypothetical protein [Chloroflexus sp.]
MDSSRFISPMMTVTDRRGVDLAHTRHHLYHGRQAGSLRHDP